MTSTTLMNAILSMDSYNRGYEQGIVLSENQTQVGSANISINSEELGTTDVNGQDVRNDSIIGFFAQAYSLNGETIISYRGTDDIVQDGYYGWSLGLGNEDNPQARMAIEFFNEVVGSGNDPQTANITTTGHSMGGGLAGLTASIYGKDASIYDSMHFVEGANDTTQYRVDLKQDNLQNTQTVYVTAADWDTYSPPEGWSIFSHSAPSTPDIYADTYLTNPDFSGVSSYRVAEILERQMTGL